MASSKVPVKRDGVRFHFINADEDDYLPGTVLLRDGEMVLDIPGGCGPYLIVGKAIGHRFEGMNNVRGSTTQVTARWADVGGMYVGVWQEGGSEYLFSFEF